MEEGSFIECYIRYIICIFMLFFTVVKSTVNFISRKYHIYVYFVFLYNVNQKNNIINFQVPNSILNVGHVFYNPNTGKYIK